MGMIQEFQKADKERRREVAALAKETDAFVKDLTKGSAERASNVKAMLGDFAKGDDERRSEVAAMRSEADAFVKDLAKGSAQRHSDVSAMLDELAKGDAERASEVATMRSETDAMVKDLTKGSAERASEVATMRSEANAFVKDLAKGSAQRHIMVWGVAPGKKMAPPPVEELPKEIPPEAPVGELRDRVFAYLVNHPGGTRLTKLEEEFGLARIQIARVVRGLMDDHKVRKHELLYFAI